MGLPAASRHSRQRHKLSIAAASVLAKVHRDRLLVELDAAYPGYGLARHKGYCSPEHWKPLPVSAPPRSTEGAISQSPRQRYNSLILIHAGARYEDSALLPVISIACLCLAGCGGRHPPKKPDPTKGTVTGIVICDDTGKPARFATVTLTAAPAKDAKENDGGPLPSLENPDTDLDGRFRMEAVERDAIMPSQPWKGISTPSAALIFQNWKAWRTTGNALSKRFTSGSSRWWKSR